MLGDVKVIIVTILAGIVMAAGALFKTKRDARRNRDNETKLKDFEDAKDISDRVRDDHADELHKHDDAGWRDEENDQ